MPARRLRFGRLAAIVALAAFASACTTAGATAPVGSQAAALPSSAPSAAPSVAPSVAPVEPSVAPTDSPTPAPTRSAAATPGGGGRYGGGGGGSTPAPGLVIKSFRTSLGTVLVGSDGLTLYIHAGDGTNHSTCTSDCAAAWPPVLVKAGSKVGAGAGVHGKLATFKRADGTLQVSYNGRPLYGWTGDSAPGDTTGQGVGGFSVAKA